MSNEKNKIINEIIEKFKLSEKKKTTILNGKKILKVEKILKNKEYEKLSITEEKFNLDLENVKRLILDNKDIKKQGININIDKLEYLANKFKFLGKLDEDIIKSVLEITDEEVSKFIFRKFDNIKYKYVKNISLNEEDLNISINDKLKVGFNYNNYLIGDNNKVIENLASLLINLNEEEIDKILNNKDLVSEISFLLPFINIVEELDVDTYKNIILSYDKVKNKILEYSTENEILKNIDDIISLANAYNSLDDITLLALGEKVVLELEEHNSLEYFEFYKKMLNKKESNIPPVNFKHQNYYLESGFYSDPNRLLIGKIPDKKSCIDLLNVAGKGTYSEVLLGKSADAILVKNEEKDLVSRILVFRRGNVIQMGTVSSEIFPISLYQKIADQIIKESILKDDNIDYVFLNELSSSIIDKKIYIKDSRFVTKFPHADFSENAILLSSKNKIKGLEDENINLNFYINPKSTYEKLRREVSYNPSKDDINRLRALKIAMENNLEIKENLSSNFETIYLKNYNNIVCGEDWYIGIKKDGTIEELSLDTQEEKMEEEKEKARNFLGINLTGKEDRFQKLK